LVISAFLLFAKGFAGHATHGPRLDLQPAERDRAAAGHAQAVGRLADPGQRAADGAELDQLAVGLREVDFAIGIRPPVTCSWWGPARPAAPAPSGWRAQGWQVVLVDQHDFPRDKVCGDGLIPDAHHALQRLGVLAEVMAQARPATHVGCIGGLGGRVDVPGRLAVLPRRQLDDILKRAAERAGARFFAPWRFEAPLLDGERRPPPVVGARLKSPGRRVRGACPLGGAGHRRRAAALMASGLCTRHTPSGVALRGYVHHPGLVGRVTALEVVWHKQLRKGYGWIFPCPGGVFNIGVGLAHSHDRRWPAAPRWKT
jgi:hypothetical protein